MFFILKAHLLSIFFQFQIWLRCLCCLGLTAREFVVVLNKTYDIQRQNFRVLFVVFEFILEFPSWCICMEWVVVSYVECHAYVLKSFGFLDLPCGFLLSRVNPAVQHWLCLWKEEQWVRVVSNGVILAWLDFLPTTQQRMIPASFLFFITFISLSASLQGYATMCPRWARTGLMLAILVRIWASPSTPCHTCKSSQHASSLATLHIKPSTCIRPHKHVYARMRTVAYADVT